MGFCIARRAGGAAPTPSLHLETRAGFPRSLTCCSRTGFFQVGGRRASELPFPCAEHHPPPAALSTCSSETLLNSFQQFKG